MKQTKRLTFFLHSLCLQINGFIVSTCFEIWSGSLSLLLSNQYEGSTVLLIMEVTNVTYLAFDSPSPIHPNIADLHYSVDVDVINT